MCDWYPCSMSNICFQCESPMHEFDNNNINIACNCVIVIQNKLLVLNLLLEQQ